MYKKFLSRISLLKILFVMFFSYATKVDYLINQNLEDFFKCTKILYSNSLNLPLRIQKWFLTLLGLSILFKLKNKYNQMIISNLTLYRQFETKPLKAKVEIFVSYNYLTDWYLKQMEKNKLWAFLINSA